MNGKRHCWTHEDVQRIRESDRENERRRAAEEARYRLGR